MAKPVGGRGYKADPLQKHRAVSVTLHPEVLAILAEYEKTTGQNRSEVVNALVRRHAKMWPPKEKKDIIDVSREAK